MSSVCCMDFTGYSTKEEHEEDTCSSKNRENDEKSCLADLLENKESDQVSNNIATLENTPKETRVSTTLAVERVFS